MTVDENEQLRVHVKELQEALANLIYSHNFRSRAVRDAWRQEARVILYSSQARYPGRKES